MIPSKHKQSFLVRRWCSGGHISRLGGRWLLRGCGPSGSWLRGLHCMTRLRRNVRGRSWLCGGGIRIIRPLLLLKVDWFIHYSIATDDCLWGSVSARLGCGCGLVWLGGHLGGKFRSHCWTSLGGRLSCVITGTNAEVCGFFSLIAIWSQEVRGVVKLSPQFLFFLLLFVLLTDFVKMLFQPQTNQSTGTFL